MRPGLLTQTLCAARNRMFGRPHAEAWLAARSLRSRSLPCASHLRSQAILHRRQRPNVGGQASAIYCTYVQRRGINRVSGFPTCVPKAHPNYTPQGVAPLREWMKQGTPNFKTAILWDILGMLPHGHYPHE